MPRRSSSTSTISTYWARVTVQWGYEDHSIVIGKRRWQRIVAGRAVECRGQGYHYEGEFMWDYWKFGGGITGSLKVTYGQDGGTGFDGNLLDCSLELSVSGTLGFEA